MLDKRYHNVSPDVIIVSPLVSAIREISATKVEKIEKCLTQHKKLYERDLESQKNVINIIVIKKLATGGKLYLPVKLGGLKDSE
eukprot:snap_masked-scaffold_30-processed-gene-1.33-mRNA-1 protein AED:1.00 eAED:1.00 QI:0/-1/0/0/-1/1/1/0/83